MDIKNINITITPDELEIIGFGIEECIERYAATMPRETLELLHSEEKNLLHGLIQAGYSIWLNADSAKKILNGRRCHDVDEFIDYLYRENNTDGASA